MALRLSNGQPNILPSRREDPAPSLDEGSSELAERVNVVKPIILTTLVPRLIHAARGQDPRRIGGRIRKPSSKNTPLMNSVKEDAEVRRILDTGNLSPLRSSVSSVVSDSLIGIIDWVGDAFRSQQWPFNGLPS